MAFLLLFLIIFSAAAPVFAGENPAADSANHRAELLIVCKTQEELDELTALAAACRKWAEPVLLTDFDPAILSDFRFLITTADEVLAQSTLPTLAVGDDIQPRGGVQYEALSRASVTVEGAGFIGSTAFEEEISYIKSHLGTEAFGTLHLRGESHPFAATAEQVTYVPYYRAGELSALLLGAVMQDFFGHTDKGSLYVMLDEVYAFSDLYALCYTADLLYESDIPFVVRIMPLYDNLDYPAFARFGQALRYLQAKNGSIVIAPPLITSYEMEREPLEDKMARFEAALIEQEIDFLDFEYMPYLLSTETLESLTAEHKNFGLLPIDTVLRVPVHEDEQAAREEVARLNHLWLTVTDYRASLRSDRPLYHEKEIDEDFAYIQEQEKWLAEEFAVGNEVLVVIVSLLLLILGSLILIGARIHRRKFYNP